MTTEERSWLRGSQQPTYESVPVGDEEFANKAVEFVRWAGMSLYPWQEQLLHDTLLQREDGLWSSREVVVSLARQNGKGEYLVALELVAIYLCGAKSLMHSAHFLDTAMDARDRLWDVIEDHDGLMSWWEDEYGDVPRRAMGNGKEAIIFPNKTKAYFRTRTKKTGRGLSFDWLVFDEAFNIPGEVYAAMNNTTKARPNAQKVFISSPVNRLEHDHGAIFSAKRWAGMDGAEGTLFKEWSIDPEKVDPFSEEAWIQSNPSLVDQPRPGVQMDEVRLDSIAAKKSADLKESFLVETLGVGNWVPKDGDADDFTPIIDFDRWKSKSVKRPQATGDTCVGLDVSPDGDHAAMVAALRTTTGIHLALAPGADFDRERLVGSIAQTVELNDPLAVMLDPKGPASTLEGPLAKRGVEPELMSWKTVAAATELFLQLFAEGTITHDGDPRWEDALSVAEFRDVGASGRALTRRKGAVCELVAAMFAVYGLTEFEIPDAPTDIKRKTRFVGKAQPIKATPGASSMAF